MDAAPIGTYVGDHFVMNFGGEISGTFYVSNKVRRYYVCDACGQHGISCLLYTSDNWNKISNKAEYCLSVLLKEVEILPGMIAVSYTHLDVYKRQIPPHIKEARVETIAHKSKALIIQAPPIYMLSLIHIFSLRIFICFIFNY